LIETEVEMNREGYLLLPGFLDPTQLRTAMAPYKTRTEYIFNAPGSNDHKRRQMTLSQSTVQELRREILSLPFLSNVHHVEDFVLLRSLSGCKRQAAHTDYIPEASLLQCEPYNLPLLFLFALEGKTKLVVWPGSHKVIQGRGRTLEPIQPTVVELNAGDALVFRADLVHAGAEYETENLRIHCYIDSEVVKRNPNRTWIIGTHADELVRKKIVED
jgi:hypothetical protein